MRKILFFSAFILFSVVSNGQIWTLQNTNMSGNSTGVDQISTVDSNIVWINGFNGSGTTQRIKVSSRTQDGGTTWVPGTYAGFGATVYPQVLTGVTYNKAFAVGFDTVTGGFASFWKTTDGGSNWSLVTGVMNGGASTFADGVLFWNTDKGFCYGDPISGSGKFDIYYTSDGGNNWTPVLATNATPPLTGEYGYNGFECTSKMEGGYAAFITNMGRIYKTSDYGVSWTSTTTAPFAAIGIGKVYITGVNKIITGGILTGATAYTWKQTTDGGATWTNYSPTGKFYTYAMTYVPYSNNMLVSSSPFILTGSGVSYSNNGGGSWTDFIDPLLQTGIINNQCLAVGFSDINNGWVGNYDTLFNSILKYKNNIVISGIQNNIIDKNSFEFYPNPANGTVHFNFPTNNNANASISIIDITGKTIFKQVIAGISNTSFDFTGYSKGIYFVKYTSDAIEKVKKLIIN